MTSFLQDLKQSSRSLLRSPGFALVAVLTLGLGIGASTAIYSLVERVVLDPLPYPEADRLVRLTSETSEGTWQLSRAQYSLFRDQSQTIEELAGFRVGEATILTSEGAERVGVWGGTSSLFSLLGARPELGRLIREQDDVYGGTSVAVLSYGYWRRMFGGDPSVIGRTLTLNETPIEVVGVMQPDLELPENVPAQVRPDIWLPLQLNLSGEFWNSHMEFRTLARLAPGVTAADASRELAGFNPTLIETFPQAYGEEFVERYGFRTEATPLKEALVGDVAGILWILLAGVGLVLAIACANIANLFLVRAEGERRDMAVRVALGASRGSILRYFFAEGLVLSMAGGILALVLAFWGVEWLMAGAPAEIPRLDGLALDGSILAVTAGLVVLVALALAVLPGLRYMGLAGMSGALAQGGRNATSSRERQGARRVLVVGQVAAALVLVVGAGLLMESFRRVRAVDPGVDAAGVLAIQVSLPSTRYDTLEKHWAFYSALLQRVRALPGVASAGAGGALPFADGYNCTVQAFTDAAVMERIRAANGTLCGAQLSVTDGYFEALGIPLLAGRYPTAADNDHPAAGSIVVSKAFADKFWPGEEPLGKQVAPAGRSQGPFYTVVGVTGDVYAVSPTDPPAVAIYYPVLPIPPSGGLWGGATNLVVRSAGADPMTLFPLIREAALELDPRVPLANPRTMTSLLAESMSGLAFTMTLLGLASVTALLLAAIGLYGVLSYLVQRRTREIGVRIALGARPRQVERMVVGGSLQIAAAGLVLGLLAALALTRFLSSLLYEVEPSQPGVYIAAALLLGAVAGLASWLPARRAAAVHPVEALRAE